MHTGTRALVVAAFLALSLLAFPGAAEAQEDAEVVEVRLVETGEDSAPFAFEPQVVEISPGTTVRWINDADVFHTITSTDSQEERKSNGEYQGSVSQEGDTFEHTFEESGTFEYFCQPHAGFMFGTVEVAGGSEGGDDQGQQQSPLPAAVAVIALLGAIAALRRR